MTAITQPEIDQQVFDLYDEYCHGRIDRREFMRRAGALGAAALVMATGLLPNYAQAQTISFTDTRIKASYVTYPSPGGNSDKMRGYLVQPADNGPWPAVLVIHENRGLRTSRTWRVGWRWMAFSRSRPTASRRWAAIRATTTTGVRCRRSSIRPSCAPTC
jgi:hypothetical protein